MGTRSLTHIKEERKTLVTIYRQSDGYPTGHGQKLADFLKDRKIINGISMGDTDDNAANGMGCLAAQLIAHLKDGIGGVYIDAPGRKADWEDYVYTVTEQADGLHLSCKNSEGKLLYTGPAREFDGGVIEKLSS